MTADISELYKMGVELGMTSVIIVGIIALISVVQDLGSVLSEQQVTVDRINEYREYNQFDDTIVYPQDIVSAVYQYRGMPYVYVKCDANELIWSSTMVSKHSSANKLSDYKAATITALIDQNRMYKATLEYGSNGQMEGICFIGQ